MERSRVPVARVVDRIDQRRWWVAVGLVGIGLVAAWGLALSSGSLTAVSRHWFYLPVVLAAVRFGLRGALITGAAAGLLAGPAVFTAEGAATAYGVWVTRGAFFLVVGVSVAGLVGVVRESQQQAVALAEQGKRLAYQRAALIQTVSHEFRTPLTILHGGIQTLEARQDQVAERLRPLIASLGRAERRLDQMVSVVLGAADALDASQRLDAEPASLEVLVGTVTASLDRPDASERVTLDIDPDADQVVTVPGYLQLALRCVIDNALRFSPSDRPVTVNASRDNAAVVIGVHDEGPGIDRDFLDEMFEPFTQADSSSQRAHGGLGIGLFTARKVVERLGGSIHVSEADPHGTVGGDGEGTTVQIVLPQRRETDQAGCVRRRGDGAPRLTVRTTTRASTTSRAPDGTNGA